MEKILPLFTAFAMLVFLFSCQKNIDTFIPDASQPASSGWQNTITANSPVAALKSELSKIKITDSFAYNNAGSFFSSGPLAISVPANGLVNPAGGFPVGIIDRQTLLVQKKGDFISMSMPTVSNGRLLVSGGAYFISLKNNNNELLVPQGKKLGLQYSANAPSTQGMKLFNGTEDLPAGFNWILNTDTAFNKVFPSLNGYEVQTNKLQWLHTARFFDTAGIAQTTLTLGLPPNYTNTNTVAYISFNDMQCVAGIHGNVIMQRFISGNLPVNRAVTVVVISKQGGDYYFGRLVTNTSAASGATPDQQVIITPVITPLSAIKSYLETL